MKAYGRMDIYIYIYIYIYRRFLYFGTSSRYIGGWVRSRAGLDNMEKITFLSYQVSNSNPFDVKSTASRYTDCAILASNLSMYAKLGHQNNIV
jgi:hypothetical protein